MNSAARRPGGASTKAPSRSATLSRSGISINTLNWTGDRLDYSVTALAQTVDGQIDVGQDMVRVEVRMPLLLSMFAQKIQQIVGKEGNKLLLTKK